MIRYTQGNILEADTDALVNTVNTVGVMGKGMTLMFKEAYPLNFDQYKKACKDGGLHWPTVRNRIASTLGRLQDTEVAIFEPTAT